MSDLTKIGDEFKRTGAVEHVINILRAAASTNPYTGPIASLISDYIPSQRLLRLEEFVKNITEDLKKFKDEVNDDNLKTDEFAFIFEKCFRGAVENYQAEKIHAFRAILINSIRPNQISQIEKEFFLNLIDRLTFSHIRVLAFMANPHKYLDERTIPRTNVEGSFRQFFPRVMPDVQLDYIKLVFQDLNGYGFLNTDKSIFSTMTSTAGYELLGQRLTPTGIAFINFITLPN